LNSKGWYNRETVALDERETQNPWMIWTSPQWGKNKKEVGKVREHGHHSSVPCGIREKGPPREPLLSAPSCHTHLHPWLSEHRDLGTCLSLHLEEMLLDLL
jgi:hypothetical protein